MYPSTTTASPQTVSVSSHGLPTTDVPTDFTQMMQLAEQLATATDFLPEALRGKPGNVLAVMLRARALDIPLAVAWDELYVIKGSIGQSARLVRGLARRAGHRIAYVEHDRFHAVALIHCAGEATPHEVRFTFQEAVSMGLTEANQYGKGGENWDRQPENMLIARVTTRAVTWYCPEVMLGLGSAYVEGAPEDLAPTSDLMDSMRADNQEKVDWALRMTGLIVAKQGNGAQRLELLRSVFLDARDHLVLDCAADADGMRSVRNLLTEHMRDADRLAKAQAAGEAPAVDAAEGPCGLDDLLALLNEDGTVKGEEEADPGDIDGPQDDPFPQGKAKAPVAKVEPDVPPKKARARKRVSKAVAVREAPAGAPAPGATPPAPEAPAKEPEMAAEAQPPARSDADPAGRAGGRAPGGAPIASTLRPEAVRPEDRRVLPCGCVVDDVIFMNKHTCAEFGK